MRARLLDGKQLAKARREQLVERVALLRARGIIPHLFVILPTRGEAAHTYFRAKARAAEKLGIAIEWCTSLEARCRR